MTQPVRQRLLNIMQQKRSNLAVAADVTSSHALLDIAEQVGGHICILKTHIDIINDFTPKLIEQLKEIAYRQNFLLFEDRKFADIGHTTHLQFTQGIFAPCKVGRPGYCSCTTRTRHPRSYHESCLEHECGILLLLEMSSHANLLTPEYSAHACKIASDYPNIITGVIAQKATSNAPWLTLTPGVKMHPGQDNTGQRYNTPETAIMENRTDIIIVGRGITQASNLVESAEQFQEKGWQLYQQRVRNETNNQAI